MKRTTIVTVAAAVAMAAGTGLWLRADDNPPAPAGRPAKAEVTGKVYDVKDLVAEHRDSSYKGLVLTVADGDDALAGRPRDSGSLFGTGGMGGGAGGGAEQYPGADPFPNLPPRMKEICQSVQAITGEALWADPTEASIKAFDGRLVIRQTAEGHKKVAEALAQLQALANEQVVVDAVWVRATGAAPRTLSEEALAKADVAWRGRVTCYNGQQTYTLGGRAQTAVVGFQAEAGAISGEVKITTNPIAGLTTQPTSQPAEEKDKKPTATINVTSIPVPIVRMAHVGMAMDVRPVLSGDRKSCQVELFAVISRSRTDKPTPAVKDVLTPMDCDAQTFCATAAVPLGQWVVVTGCTVPEGLAKGEMYLAVRATRVEGIR